MRLPDLELYTAGVAFFFFGLARFYDFLLLLGLWNLYNLSYPHILDTTLFTNENYF